ncbi:MAG: PQQ-like beta-propeller repeat protein [Planctomycetaceae bacterium]|nr:PQQ-like beta-propeller repeat protein [Planctomycetaceae bacterium]
MPVLPGLLTIRVLLVLAVSFSFVAASEKGPEQSSGSLSWPNRFGPLQNGHALEADSKGLPTTWNEESGENIAWKVPIENFGHSTPIIGQGRIWLTSATDEGTKQWILCLDEMTGKTIHKKLLFENVDPEPLGNKINTYASPSCWLESDAVYVHFGTYGTARLNPETANIVWQRRDIHARHFRGPGSSPVVHDNILVLTFDGIDQQFLIALDKRTGETLWRTERSTDYGDLDENGQPKADGDYRKAYSTPGLVEVNGRMQIVSVGSRAAFAYDLKTGKEVWTITHDDYNAAARPVFYKDLAILNTGSRGANLLAVRLDASTQRNVDDSHVIWNRERGNSDLSNPILLGDRVYMITNNGVAVCLNAETGEELWTARIGGTFVASPVSANGVIYFSNEEGETTVVRAADEYEEVAKNILQEGMRSSPAIANGALFLRTFGHLYKLGGD